MIELDGVSMVYRSRGKGAVTALDDLHLRVDEGELITLVGPSGCGKSTILKLVSGLLQASAGQVKIHGQPVRGPRREMGFVFQTPVLLPWRTVRDNVLLPIEMLGLPVKQHVAAADALLESVCEVPPGPDSEPRAAHRGTIRQEQLVLAGL
jgi:NitT/TauT family transport system ATP-binding protein